MTSIFFFASSPIPKTCAVASYYWSWKKFSKSSLCQPLITVFYFCIFVSKEASLLLNSFFSLNQLMISTYSNTFQVSQFLRSGLMTLLVTSRQVSSYFFVFSNLIRQTSILLFRIVASQESYSMRQWSVLSLLNYQLSASISALNALSECSRISSPIVLLFSEI